MSGSNILLNKQPILNTQKEVFAYQLSVDVLESELESADFQPQLETLYQDIEEAGGIALITQQKPIFFKIHKNLLDKSLLPKVPEGTKLIVEIDNSIIGDGDSLIKLKTLAESGISIALNLTDLTKDNKLLSAARYVKISAQKFSAEAISSMMANLKDKELILTDVDSDECLESYSGLSMPYYQGFFFTEPVIHANQEIESNRLVLLKLLAEVNDPDVSFEQIVETVQVDAVLSHKLISAINHPQNDLPVYVENLKDAVTYMGLKRLKFWVNLLVMSQLDDIPQELLVTALIRAKFLESLAISAGMNVDKDRFFMVGLFSTLNAFLKISMLDIVDKLPVSDEIRIALVDQSGSMGKALFIVKSLEQGNTQLISMGYEHLGMMEVSSDYMKANGWAYQTLASLNS